MATTAIQTEPNLTPAVQALLGSLRGWIRLYVWLEGLAVAAAWLGVAFWTSLAIDWFFEPPPAVRGVILALVGLVLAGVLLHVIGRRAFVRLSNGNMAMLLERRFPQLNESLLTAVVLTERRSDPAECNRQMLACTCRQAAQRIRGVELRGVFNPLPLRRGITAAVLLSATVVAFGLLSPEAFGVWKQRSLLFSSELWPRKVHLLVEGFDENGVAKVAHGDDFKVVAKAETKWPDEPPQVVRIRYHTGGGAQDPATMNRLGTSGKGKDRFQEYSCTFQFQDRRVPVRFDLLGGDARVRDLRIEVVENPSVDEMTLHCSYPSYMERAPRRLPVTGQMQVPQGTEITIHARTNKELVDVQIDSTAGERSLSRAMLRPEDLAADRRSFRYTLPSLHEDTTLSFTLSDTDGITGSEPVRLRLVAVPDSPPQLAVRLDGIGSAITPQARLPAVGQITDDYGIGKVWFEYTIDRKKPSTRPVGISLKRPTSLKLDDAALEVRDLPLTPGQRLLVGLKAADLCDLGPGPNIGSSQRRLLDIVTPEQLRAMLESRELVLRQRFEAIIQEVAETRDLLLPVDFAAPDTTDDAGERTPQRSGKRKTDESAEPGDEPAGEEGLSPEGLLALRRLRLRRALTNSRKNAHETQAVADAFGDICLQLTNNRIDTEELNIRLKQGIANPLRRIAQQMFPLLQLRLQRLQEKLDDENLGPQRRELARQQADVVLLQMRKVLDRMIELEDYNQAVDLLRVIINAQEQLSDQTQQRHKQTIREFLED